MDAYEFPVRTGKVPQDNGYALFSALCREVPPLHGRYDIQIAPLRGTRCDDDKNIRMDRGSILHIRGITAEEALKIQGCGRLFVGDQVLFLDPCRMRALVPSPLLVSRLTILPDMVGEMEFLATLGGLVPTGTQVRLGRKRALSYKGRKYLGYSVVLTGLTSDDSLRIQERGIGKFTSQGCGVFYPGSPRTGAKRAA